jgi:hypothetical protein
MIYCYALLSIYVMPALAQWFTSIALVLLSFCVSRIYVRLSTSHITCIYNGSMMYYINIVLARNVWHRV